MDWLATTPIWWPVPLAIVVVLILFMHSYWWACQQRKNLFAPISEDAGSNKVNSEKTVEKPIDLVLKPPKHIYTLVWDAPENIQIITRPILSDGAKTPLGVRIPVLRIKNLGKEVARNLIIKWRAGTFGHLERGVLSCTRLHSYMPTIQGNMFGLTYTDKGTVRRGWQATFSPSETSDIEYLAPVIDNKTYESLPIPYSVWAYVEILAVATLPETPLFSTVSVPIEVKITGKNGVTVAHFAVIAKVHSTKPGGTGVVKIPIDGKMRTPPEVMAEVRFEIKQMDG